MNIDYNSVQHCLKYTSELTRKVYHNVCNGETYVVPHGFWDYLYMGSVSIFILLSLLAIPLFIYLMESDW